MDIENLWKTTGNNEIDNLNIVKSWLCGSTDGQTYSITDNVFDYDVPEEYVYEFPESAFDDIVGYKHDYKIDDENLDAIAKRILKGLSDLNEDIKRNPQSYFKRKTDSPKCNAIKGVYCDWCVMDNECTYSGVCPFKK